MSTEMNAIASKLRSEHNEYWDGLKRLRDELGHSVHADDPKLRSRCLTEQLQSSSVSRVASYSSLLDIVQTSRSANAAHVTMLSHSTRDLVELLLTHQVKSDDQPRVLSCSTASSESEEASMADIESRLSEAYESDSVSTMTMRKEQLRLLHALYDIEVRNSDTHVFAIEDVARFLNSPELACEVACLGDSGIQSLVMGLTQSSALSKNTLEVIKKKISELNGIVGPEQGHNTDRVSSHENKRSFCATYCEKPLFGVHSRPSSRCSMDESQDGPGNEIANTGSLLYGNWHGYPIPRSICEANAHEDGTSGSPADEPMAPKTDDNKGASYGVTERKFADLVTLQPSYEVLSKALYSVLSNPVAADSVVEKTAEWFEARPSQLSPGSRGSPVSDLPRSQYVDCEVDVDHDLISHSFVVCPVLRTMSGPGQEGAMFLLPCGHVACKATIDSMLATAHRVSTGRSLNWEANRKKEVTCHSCPVKFSLGQLSRIF